MDQIVVSPGDIVVTNFSGYQHYSIVSNKRCDEGKPMLISASRRTGTVQEEPWDLVTRGKKTYPTRISHELPLHQILINARAMIGQWQYCVARRNCEHFVTHVLGLKSHSRQVDNGLIGAAAGLTLASALSEKPTVTKYLCSAAALAGAAVLASKAKRKKAKTEEIQEQPVQQLPG